MKGSITDVKGIKVGQVSDYEGITGITVVLCEEGATASCLVIGGAPGTRETDLLNPQNMVEKVHAVFLAGGSAFGLDAASGIVRYLEEKDVGFDTGVAKVPIVTGAILFDLAMSAGIQAESRRAKRPTPEMAYKACIDASSTKVESGSVGAGTGATCGKLMGPSFAMKSGVGTSSLLSKRGFRCGALVAVNPLGNVYHPVTGKMVAGTFDRKRKIFIDDRDLVPSLPVPWTNTTIGVVALDADLTKAECQRIAIMAASGIARCVRPSFTPFDGDTVFSLSTGQKHINEVERMSVVLELGWMAQECFSRAILDSVLSSKGLGGVPGVLDIDAPPLPLR